MWCIDEVYHIYAFTLNIVMNSPKWPYFKWPRCGYRAAGSLDELIREQKNGERERGRSRELRYTSKSRLGVAWQQRRWEVRRSSSLELGEGKSHEMQGIQHNSANGSDDSDVASCISMLIHWENMTPDETRIAQTSLKFFFGRSKSRSRSRRRR